MRCAFGKEPFRLRSHKLQGSLDEVYTEWMKSYEIIDISGDAGIRAYGRTGEDLFSNAAMGMYSLITDLEGVHEAKEVLLSVESHNIEGLLVSWLNELIFQFDT